MAQIRMELVRQMADLRAELRREMQELRVELCTEIRMGGRRIVRHMYAGLLAQMAVLLGFAYFFVR